MTAYAGVTYRKGSDPASMAEGRQQTAARGLSPLKARCVPWHPSGCQPPANKPVPARANQSAEIRTSNLKNDDIPNYV